MYQWKNGSKYFGDWKNGKMHGEGNYTFGVGKGEGDRYVGEYRNGIRSGKGIYTWSNGERYVGDFKNDLREIGRKAIRKVGGLTLTRMAQNS